MSVKRGRKSAEAELYMLRHSLSGLRSWLSRHGLGKEDGSLLIEVMVTSMIMTIVSLAAFAALDGANATSGTDRARAMAAGVAQQDQERMRSFRSVDLSNYRETYTQSVAAVPYTVNSRADWVTDSSGSASCTSTDASADYLKITSSVSWPRRGPARPLVVSSLVATPNGSFNTNQGALAVQVRDPAGNPVSGVNVQLAGPQGFTDATNAQGCVLWGFLQAGNYTVTLASGCVDHQGVSPPSKAVSVIGDATNTVALDCGFAGLINASFDTLRQPGSVLVPNSKARYLRVANSGLDPPGSRQFGNGSAVTTIAATSLFPFTDPYNVYSGNCDKASPTQWAQPLSPAPNGTTVAAGSTNNVTIRQPSLNVRVNSPSSPTRANGAHVTASATQAGCVGTVLDMGLTNSSGVLIDPGVPYGTYTVCADFVVSGTRRKDVFTPVAASQPTVPNGGTQYDVTVSSSDPAGSCP
jgi:Tfp pilus assembly protein PilV